MGGDREFCLAGFDGGVSSLFPDVTERKKGMGIKWLSLAGKRERSEMPEETPQVKERKKREELSSNLFGWGRERRQEWTSPDIKRFLHYCQRADIKFRRKREKRVEKRWRGGFSCFTNRVDIHIGEAPTRQRLLAMGWENSHGQRENQRRPVYLPSSHLIPKVQNEPIWGGGRGKGKESLPSTISATKVPG